MKLFLANLFLFFKFVISDNAIVLVDVQKCFLDEFPVYGATLDFDIVAEKIESNIDNVDYIAVVKDSHNNQEINNKLNWINSTGHNPSEYDEILLLDIGRKWWPLSVSLEYAKNYSIELSRNKKNPIIIWPEHCIIDTDGHNIIDNIQIVLNKWENQTNKEVVYIEKGLNKYSEEYGILPDARLPDALKNLNMENINKVMKILLNYKNITIIGDNYSPSVLPIFYDFHELTFDWLKMPINDCPRINLNLDLIQEVQENVQNAFDWVKKKIKNVVDDFIETIFIDEL